MIDIDDIHIDDREWRIHAERSGAITTRLLVHTINEIARDVESKAKEFAPIGKGFNPTDVPGTLKRHGVIRHDAHAHDISTGDSGVPGESVTDISAFGGGFTVRGSGGRFTSATQQFDPGHIFTGGFRSRTIVSAVVELNPLVRHAKWVHEGTGIYGPAHHPIVPRVKPFLVFRWHGRRFEKKSVKGQKPQPFLTEAYIYVNNVSTPAKLSILRAELSAEL